MLPILHPLATAGSPDLMQGKRQLLVVPVNWIRRNSDQCPASNCLSGRLLMVQLAQAHYGSWAAMDRRSTFPEMFIYTTEYSVGCSSTYHSEKSREFNLRYRYNFRAQHTSHQPLMLEKGIVTGLLDADRPRRIPVALKASLIILWRICPLLGNGSLNTFPQKQTRGTIGHLFLDNAHIRRQQSDNSRCYATCCKYNNRGSCAFYVVRIYPLRGNGYVFSGSASRLYK
jgi:hypothetical protein